MTTEDIRVALQSVIVISDELAELRLKPNSAVAVGRIVQLLRVIHKLSGDLLGKGN